MQRCPNRVLAGATVVKADNHRRHTGVLLLAILLGLNFVRPLQAADLVISCIEGELGPAAPLYYGGTVTDVDTRSAYSARGILCNQDGGITDVMIATSDHPMLVQNLYRLKDGRFQQIGMSLAHHLGAVTNEDICGASACGAPFGTINAIYPDCAADLAGSYLAARFRMGPRAEIDPVDPDAPSPFTSSGTSGPTVISKRLQVRHDDLDPALNVGARYFLEMQVVESQDRILGAQHDNSSSREVRVEIAAQDEYDLVPVGPTHVGAPAILVWKMIDDSVQISIIDIPDDGRLYLACRAEQVSPLRWQYNWAVYNQDSMRSVAGLGLSLSASTLVEDLTFGDVAYHSGDGFSFGTPFSSADWPATVAPGAVEWQTDVFATDPNANAIRWGTMYDFQLIANAPPAPAMLAIQPYRGAVRSTINAAGIGPGMAPDGACCLSNGACSTETELSCQELGGVFAGAGIACGVADCPQPGDSQLTLETASDCPGDSNGMAAGDVVDVELWMRNLQAPASGYQVFLLYDDALLEFRPDLSSYSATPFGTHLSTMPVAEVAPGQINLDGSSGFLGGSTSSDTLLATLAFTIRDGADCQSSRIQFRQNLPFESELSDQGTPIATLLLPTPLMTFDDVAPVLFPTSIAACFPNGAAAEAAAVAATSASDNCTAIVDLDFSTSVMGPNCDAVVMLTVMDACGNTTATSYATRIDNQPPQLQGAVNNIMVVAPAGTCEATVNYTSPVFTDNCTASPNLSCVPPPGASFPAGTTTVVCTANDSCGNMTQVSFDVVVDAVRDRLELRVQNPTDCYEAGDHICVDLVMTCLDQPVTGFNAFVAYDATLLDFIPGASSYTNSPFPIHLASPVSASIMGSTGQINLDGSIDPFGSGVEDDAVLATMCFEVRPGMGGQIYDFAFRTPPSPTFGNELSVDGAPVPTVLADDSTSTSQPRLRLVTNTIRECYLPNDLVCVELQMVCLGDQQVTGFNAFLDYDTDVLRFESGMYTNSPFPTHLSPIDPVDGRLTLDGSVIPLNPGTNLNAVLATLCFRIQKSAPGTSTTIEFGPPPSPSIDSELSINGVPVPTILEPTGILTQTTLGLRVCYEPMAPICVLLEATCLDVAVTGYTAELSYDNDILEFLPGDSGYTAMPFTNHTNEPITPAISGSTAEISLDGQLPVMDPAVMDDTVLASMCFNLRPGFEASGASVEFRPQMPGFESEFTIDGVGVPTFLRDTLLFGLAGDINLDGVVDLNDVPAFTDALLNLDINEARRLRSDLNCDARTDGHDIQQFVDILLQ